MPLKNGMGPGQFLNEKKRASKYKSSLFLDSQTKADNRKKIWVESQGSGLQKRNNPGYWKVIDPSVNDGVAIDEANGTASGTVYEQTLKAKKTYENILHNFATYNTLFTLSGLSEDELHEQTYYQDL